MDIVNFKLPEFNPVFVSKMLEKFPISKLDSYSEMWLNTLYSTNRYETTEQFQKRKDWMIVLLIKEKLSRYNENNMF